MLHTHQCTRIGKDQHSNMLYYKVIITYVAFTLLYESQLIWQLLSGGYQFIRWVQATSRPSATTTYKFEKFYSLSEVLFSRLDEEWVIDWFSLSHEQMMLEMRLCKVGEDKVVHISWCS